MIYTNPLPHDPHWTNTPYCGTQMIAALCEGRTCPAPSSAGVESRTASTPAPPLPSSSITFVMACPQCLPGWSPAPSDGAPNAVAVLAELVAWLDTEYTRSTEQVVDCPLHQYLWLTHEAEALGRVVRALTEITARHTTGATP